MKVLNYQSPMEAPPPLTPVMLSKHTFLFFRNAYKMVASDKFLELIYSMPGQKKVSLIHYL